jgi:hypothetical protein
VTCCPSSPSIRRSESGGLKHTLTIRSDTLAQLTADLREVANMIKAAKAKAEAQQTQVTAAMDQEKAPTCALHGVELRRQRSKDGAQSWWSHFDEQAQRWCHGKGRPKRA